MGGSGTITSSISPITLPAADIAGAASRIKPAHIKAITNVAVDHTDDVINTIKDGATIPSNLLGNTKTAARVAKGVANIEETLTPISDKLPSFTKKIANSAVISKAQAITGTKPLQSVIKSLAENQAVWKEAEVLEKTGFIRETGALNVLNKGIGVTGVVLGGVDIYKGVKQFNKGEKYEGGYKIAQGAVGVIGGGALMTGAVVGGVAIAPVAAVVGIGLAVGKFGNDATKELGWFKDKDGKNETAIHHLRTQAVETNDRVTKKTGSKVAGASAAYVATELQVGVTAVAIVGAAASKGLKKTGEALEKGGKAVQKFGDKMDKKADDLKKSNSFIARTAGYGGAVVVAKTSKAVGVAIEKTGEAINYAGKKIEQATGAAVKYAEAGIKHVSDAVGNTVGAVSNGISNGWSAVKSWF